MNWQLPELQDAFRVLNQTESDRLDALYGNGIPRSLNDCVTCGGEKTFRWYDDYGSEDAKVVDYDCPCSDQFVMFKYFLHSGLGRQGQRLSYGDVVDVDQRALLAADEYLQRAKYFVTRGTGLIFHGNKGTGKTLLSIILFKQLVASGFEGHFTTFNGLLDRYADGWRDDKNQAWFDKKIRNAPILVVDDIGREYDGRNKVAESALDTVLRTRLQNGLATIITTNYSPETIEDTYSSNITSLLTESSLSYHFNGSDWRAKQNAKSREEVLLGLSRPIVVA